MADVAYLLHWPPETFHPMELGELMQWRQHVVGGDQGRHQGAEQARQQAAEQGTDNDG